jgi:hypothetical protein
MRAGIFFAANMMLTIALGAHPLAGASGEQAPPQASAAGYDHNTFNSNFRNDLDLKDSRSSEHKWYLAKWFGWRKTEPTELHSDSEGALTLTSGGDTSNYTIGSAADIKGTGSDNWIGTAFGGGGYFEAEFKFDPKLAMLPGAVGFPAWWLDPVEHTRSGPIKTQWRGQPQGYEHFVEVDILEYNQWKHSPPNVYSGAVHEWYGLYKKTCPQSFCQVTNYDHSSKFEGYQIATPVGTDFRQYHKYGILWVPATEHTEGYLQYYFDGKPTGDRLSWTQFKDEPPPPSKTTPWAFGVLDRQHFVLILGTGNNQPMTVKSVNVWQKSERENIHQ